MARPKHKQQAADARRIFLEHKGLNFAGMTRAMKGLGHKRFTVNSWWAARPDGRPLALRFCEDLKPPDLDNFLHRRESGTFLNWLDTQHEPHLGWRWQHLRPVFGALTRITAGASRRLMIFMPPRHGKSELVTVRFPVWRMLGRPGQRVIVACYNQRLANKFSRSMRRVYRDWTGRFTVPPASGRQLIDTVSEWEVPGGGGVKAVGVGAGITGFGASLIVIDDPIKSRAEAESVNNRQRIWEWFNDDLRTRIEGDGPMILIQTRWHEDDLAGRLLKQMANGGEHWDVVCLPALAEEATPVRKPGEALWPERFSAARLLQLKEAMGSYSFQALYQQKPVPAEGALFKRSWFAGKTVETAPPDLRWCRGYDLAVSTRTSADYTASFRCAIDKQGNLYIADGFRRRIEFPEQRRYIIERILVEKDTSHGIEAALHGQAFVQEMMREQRLVKRSFKAVRADADKFTRALAWANRAEGGKVFLVRGPWIEEFLAEVYSFPSGRHDDQVDAVSLAVQMLSERSEKPSGLFL